MIHDNQGLKEVSANICLDINKNLKSMVAKENIF